MGDLHLPNASNAEKHGHVKDDGDLSRPSWQLTRKCQSSQGRQGHAHLHPSIYLVDGFNPSEKYQSQIGSSSQLLGK